MFRVTADTLQAYVDFDPERKRDLTELHKLVVPAAPALKRYFHRGTPAGEAGMRMKMIGYGKFRYAVKSGKSTEWPVIGVALQKNYISVYVAVTRQGVPVVSNYAGKLGELRLGATTSVSSGSTTSSSMRYRPSSRKLPASSKRILKIQFATCRAPDLPVLHPSAMAI